MREIKFRAFVKFAKVTLDVIYIDFERKRVYCKTKLNNPNPLDFYEFEDIELMQHTGLKDKNGVEIYEGDILSFDNNHYEIVVFRDGGFAIENPLGYAFFQNNLDVITKQYSIIGNIYENKELPGETNECNT